MFTKTNKSGEMTGIETVIALLLLITTIVAVGYIIFVQILGVFK